MHLLLCDNAPVALWQCTCLQGGFERLDLRKCHTHPIHQIWPCVMSHPPYSPDLALCDVTPTLFPGPGPVWCHPHPIPRTWPCVMSPPPYSPDLALCDVTPTLFPRPGPVWCHPHPIPRTWPCVMSHPPYSPDLALCDVTPTLFHRPGPVWCHTHPIPRTWPCVMSTYGKHFEDDNELTTAKEEWLQNEWMNV